MSQKPFKKPSKYITFASGWVKLDEDDGSIKSISCQADHTKNVKNNKDQQGYKLFVFPVGADGEQSGDPIEVTKFAIVPSVNVDRDKYPSSPDFRVFFGLE